MAKYTYSVVIPHYNSSGSLSRMLMSIPERDDIQVIVVDDGSCRENVEELMMLQHKNMEIVLLEENRGGGYARNVGLEKAIGKWYISVDADDYFSEDAFEVFDRYNCEDIECLFFCLNCVNEDGSVSVNRTSFPDQSVRAYIQSPTKAHERDLRFRNMASWNKLVSLSFIKKYDICYEDCKVNIDAFFSFEIGVHLRKFIAIENVLYNLVNSDNSITRKERSIEREFQFYLQVQKRNVFFEALGLKKLPYYRHDVLYIPFMIKKRGIKGAYEFFKYRKEHIEEVKNARLCYSSLIQKINPNLKDLIGVPI